MNRFRLNGKTLKSILADTGMDESFIANADTTLIDQHIEKHKKTKLKPALSIGNQSARGSVYLMFKRFFTKEEINSGIAAIIHE